MKNQLRTTAVTALRDGAKLSEIQQMLRHRIPNLTMIYLRTIEEESRREGISKQQPNKK